MIARFKEDVVFRRRSGKEDLLFESGSNYELLIFGFDGGVGYYLYHGNEAVKIAPLFIERFIEIVEEEQ